MGQTVHLCVCLASMLLLGCANEQPEVPTPPDMTFVILAYDAPSADLGDGTLMALEERAVSAIRAVNELTGVVDTVEGIIDDALAAIEGSGEADAGAGAQIALAKHGIAMAQRGPQWVTITGDGFLRIRHICHGWGETGVVDEDENGSAELTVRFSETGVNPVIWGTLDNCKYTIAGRDIILDGALNLHIGNIAQVSSVRDSPIIIQLDMRLVVDNEEIINGGFDFRVCRTSEVCPESRVELRFYEESGNYLIFFMNTGRLSGGVRDRDETWTCMFADARCESTSGESLDIPASIIAAIEGRVEGTAGGAP